MRPSRTSRSRTSRPTNRSGTIWTTFIVLMMLFSAFSNLALPAFAQGDDDTTDTTEQPAEQQVEQQVEQQAEEPTEPVTETVAEETVAPEPTETAIPQQGMVWAMIFECPWDYDPASSGDRDTMRADCNLYTGDPVASWRLTPNQSAPIVQSAMGGNTVEFAGVPTGPATLAMLSPQEPAKVYCEGNLAGGGSNTKPYASFSASSNTVMFDVLSNEEIVCDWFINDVPTLTYIFTKYICDYDYDTANKSHQDLRDDCDRPINNVSFQVMGQEGYDQTKPAPMGGAAATFENIPPGESRSREIMPAGYEFIDLYCYAHENPAGTNGPPPLPWQNQTLDSEGRLVYDMKYGMLYCDWFNRAPQYEPNYLVAYKHECALDVHDGAPTNGDAEATKAYYDDACDVVEGWEFDLEKPDGSSESKTTDADGKAVWEGLPTGSITLTEEMPDDYGASFHYCRFTEGPDAATSSGWARRDAVDGTVQSSYQDQGMGLECHVYNLAPDMGMQVTDDEPSNLTINKWVCPAGYDPTAQGVNPMMDCDPAPDGIEFTLIDEDPNTSDIMTSTGDQSSGNGYVYFGGLTPGMHTIAETQDPAYADAYLWTCDGYQNLVAMPINQGWSYGMDVPPGMDITCEWLNILADEDEEGEGFSVTLYKWRCPAGTMPDQTDPSYYSAECDTEHPGVPFALTDNTGTRNFTSDTMGYQVNNVVPDMAGTFSLAEDIQPGYLDPVGYCQPLNGPDGTPAQLANGGLTVTVPQDLDDDYQCWYYNIPEDDLADLYVYKYLCEAGYDYTMPGADPMMDCQPGPNGVSFTLSDGDPNTPDIQTMTGDSVDYRVMFGGMDPGSYTITETLLPSFESSFLWTCDGITNGAVMPWSTTGSYDIMLAAGDVITCHWFNIPMEDDHGFSVTLYKWDCPEGTMYGNNDPSYYSGACATEKPGVPFALTDGNGTRNFTSDTNGRQLDNVVPTGMGQFILAETIPAGYGDPVGYCQPLNGPDGTPMTLVNGILAVTVPMNFDDDYQCWYYNIPEDPGKVTIYKWDCPEGMEIQKTLDAHKMACVTPLDTVEFTLVDSMGPRSGATAGGMIEWDDVMIETITVTETIPLGYHPQPYVSCRFAEDNAMPLMYSVWNGILTATLNHGGQHIVCDWFNQYKGPGEITVYKWECPEGYNRHAWNADPKTDCTTPYNGVTFILDQPMDIDLQSDTGDSINGAVYFGGLMPGNYVLTEMVPPGIVDVFVLECVGMDIAFVHPVPLSVGPTLDIMVGAGDSIRCDWYNVPGYDPDYGWLTLTKYICSTPKYVSDIDCLLYTGGQKFDLQQWNGATWTTVQSGTTNAAGQLTFINLDPGTYRLVEPGKMACMIKADRITADNNLGVVADGGTTVKVYNCGTTPTTPKTPTKYPNTGVDPSGGELRTAETIGLLGLLGSGAVISRRRLLGAAALGAGTVALGRSMSAQPVIPLDAPATPEASPLAIEDCLFPATPEPSAATPEGIGAGTPVACARGATPVRIRIPTIEVDAPIEYLEFIDGQMEQPTGETDVAWYKNSARLGEQGNGIYAGHLNWWNVPEAVFFRLDQLQEGDAIEIEGDDGETYRYIVQWTEPFPSDEEPPDEALGHTPEQAITVITCGGEWVSGRAEYDHRTLVRAVRDLEAFATPGS